MRASKYTNVRLTKELVNLIRSKGYKGETYEGILRRLLDEATS